MAAVADACLNREERWRRWTKILAVLYMASQAIDYTTFFPWQHAGPGLQWIDAITTAIYSLTPFFNLCHCRIRSGTQTADDVVAIAIAAFLRRVQHLSILAAREAVHRLDADGPHGRMGDPRRRVFVQRAVPAGPALVYRAACCTVARHQFLERRRQSQIELEVKSAREVQDVLIRRRRRRFRASRSPAFTSLRPR